jgi:hypothetical protein
VSATSIDPVPYGLPAPQEIGALMATLTGRDISAGMAASDDIARSIAAVFDESETGRPTFAVVSDLGFAAFPAAALSLIPAAPTREAVAEGRLTTSLEENAYEVFNVLSRLFNGPGRPHIRLRGVYAMDECPPDALRLVGNPQVSYCVELDVEGYGAGAARVATLGLGER